MNSLILASPLGDFEFSVDSFQKLETKILSQNWNPKLPKGMEVENCQVVLIKIQAKETVENVIVQCCYKGKAEIEDFDRNSGECLEAQYWENQDYKIMIGTEDHDVLLARLPESFSPEPYSVSCKEEGIFITVPKIFAKSSTSFHFVVAWNPSPEEDESCWFAVDIRHRDIESFFKEMEKK